MLDCNFAVAAGLAALQEGPLAFQCIVNIGVRGSEHIRHRVVQAGALGVVSCILAVWLKGKGFALGPLATGSGAPQESREVCVRRQEEALKCQRTLNLPCALEHATSSDNLQASAIAQPQLCIATTTAPPPALPPRCKQYGPSPTPPPPAIGQSMSNDLDGGYVGVPLLPTPSGPLGAFAVSSGSHARSFNIRTASPIPIASTSPVMGHAISPNTAQSSNALANATPVGSGTPTGSVVVPGRDCSGTVIGRPIWIMKAGQGYNHGQTRDNNVQALSRTRYGWDDTGADGDNQTAQQVISQ
ncbi:MYND finger [Rhizoctonia solani]|uniref:MYND finger n=1 Tax=Rhizoctonia solani TaxID=456999 RepID=A0A8H7IFL4_9AGAM|nr:MYND finger [Rhizoctonia solani]